MTNAVLDQADELFVQLITDSLKKLPFQALNEPVFHLTDRLGVESILKTRSLWASLATSLLGQSEINYVLVRARSLIENNRLSGCRSLFNEMLPLLDENASPTVTMLGMKTFVCSLTTAPDERHWERHGRCGTGMALAFAMKPLVINGTLPTQVLYCQQEQDTVLRNFIEGAASLFERLADDCPSSNMEALRLRACHYSALGVWTLAPTMKPPKFSWERERRLIAIDCDHGVDVTYGKGLSREILARPGNGHSIQYKVLKYASLPVVGLELGSHAACACDDQEIQRLLFDATGGQEVPVRRAAPFHPEQAG